MKELFQSDRAKKEESELRYWKSRKEVERTLANDHYKYLYLTHFGLEDSFYKGKRILDIGCGPRGSLEWAHMALERIGLDPLAEQYMKLGANNRKMKYVKGYAENIPFKSHSFDVVCSFNSIDHVDDLEKSCREIQRVLAPGGYILLLVDVHDTPTVNEPQTITREFVGTYFGGMQLIQEKHFEKGSEGMYQSLREAIEYDHANTERRYGIISAILKKSR